MAVTADFLSDEDSRRENTHAQAYRNGPRRRAVSAAVAEDIDEVHDSRGPLSDEALGLLKRASRTLSKRKRRSTTSIVAPLYRQLKSLRTVVPYNTPSKTSCVILDGLGYLERLKQEFEDLQSSLKLQQDHSVEVADVKHGLRVRVFCKKKQGLLADLMMVLETFGLVFDDMNASCHSILTLDAFTSQEGIDFIDKKAIAKALLKAINREVEEPVGDEQSNAEN